MRECACAWDMHACICVCVWGMLPCLHSRMHIERVHACMYVYACVCVCVAARGRVCMVSQALLCASIRSLRLGGERVHVCVHACTHENACVCLLCVCVYSVCVCDIERCFFVFMFFAF